MVVDQNQASSVDILAILDILDIVDIVDIVSPCDVVLCSATGKLSSVIIQIEFDL